MISNPKSKGIIGRKRATELKVSTQEQFYEIVPESDIKRRVDDEGVCELHNGSVVYFKHMEKAEGLTSNNFNWAWIDQVEECKEKDFLHLLSRLRRRDYGSRQMWVTGNPASNWCKDKFKTPFDFKETRLAWTLKDGTKCSAWERRRKGIYVIDSNTFTNKEHLPEDYIESLLTQYPQNWINRYVYSDWDAFEGQIYPTLKESTHLIQPFPIPEDWPRVRGLDYGATNPTACIWGASDWDGNVFIYQEYEESRLPVSQHVQNILSLSPAHEHAPTFLDSTSWGKWLQKDGRASWSVADEFAEKGLPCMRANNDVLAGINRVSEYLLVDPKHTHPRSTTTGSPYLFIFSTCVKLWKSLMGYTWKEDLIKETSQKEQPLKVNEHLPDALRYLIISRPPIHTRKVIKTGNTWDDWLNRTSEEEKGQIGWETGLERR